MKRFLLKWLMKDIGAYINLDNCVYENNSKELIIKIPLKSFDKYSNSIFVEDFSYNGNKIKGKAELTILTKGGFAITSLNE